MMVQGIFYKYTFVQKLFVQSWVSLIMYNISRIPAASTIQVLP